MPKQKCTNKRVGTIFCNSRGNILLINRTKAPYGWSPPAGHVDKEEGNDFRKAAVRENLEEVGLSAKKLTLLLKRTFECGCNRRGGTWHRVYIFKARNWRGKVKASKKECRGYGWFSPAELAELSSRAELYMKGGISEKKWKKKPGLAVMWRKIFRNLSII
ncbi:MAG: hypothetical protein UW30_C0018G0019 [Candidatus Giovannonibacteria bacterium GW2011_GWA2_44_13b]|uniref:Nudix hydrolase domain-containing protein n=2 Tax=Candidatus Giovannoniibacteriota TaxID=1752738 RepID=A0A0G1JZ81_9BACT|nr:MAG: hypothetical protein UW30_C0018G0019 [Candidatus Giovannonibacteria bacterium GW2011_GWA2_44_13b]OGF83260.1 MAG: hypothetical protein A2924_02235 [Candidatus Giovannonibacteria bacterium RIFCSPLOWO2_01_FULL_44_16]